MLALRRAHGFYKHPHGSLIRVNILHVECIKVQVSRNTAKIQPLDEFFNFYANTIRAFDDKGIDISYTRQK